MATSKTKSIPSNFEDALSELDDIVSALEEDAVPLAELVRQYDRGMKLLSACQGKLDEAKQRVEVIGQKQLPTRDDNDAGSEFPSPTQDENDELF